MAQVCIKPSALVHQLWTYRTGKQSEWPDPKFPTECYFLTLHCHHLAILPIVRKYQRRLRALHDLQRMIKEMASTEAQWGTLPVAARNRELLKRWKSQLKVRCSELRGVLHSIN